MAGLQIIDTHKRRVTITAKPILPFRRNLFSIHVWDILLTTRPLAFWICWTFSSAICTEDLFWSDTDWQFMCSCSSNAFRWTSVLSPVMYPEIPICSFIIDVQKKLSVYCTLQECGNSWTWKYEYIMTRGWTRDVETGWQTGFQILQLTILCTSFHQSTVPRLLYRTIMMADKFTSFGIDVVLVDNGICDMNRLSVAQYRKVTPHLLIQRFCTKLCWKNHSAPSDLRL